MANISTQKSTFTNLKANNVKQEYTTNNITAASQGEIETIDFDLFTAEKEYDIDFDKWWENKAAPFIENVSEKTGEVLERTGATLATGTVSLIEGVGQFGEAAIDLIALATSGIGTVGTGLYDGYQALNGLITGKEWESVTKKMWGNTKEFVATEHVKTWFDKLYDNTNVGQWMKEEAYGFDTVRAVGSGVGYIAGVIGISLLTFGTGGIAIGGTSAATGTVTATQLAGTATAAGFSRGTERAWANGADIGEGLGYGALSGIWEGLQFYVGAKISAPGGFGDQIAAKFANNSALAGTLARVSLDGATGGAEGFMQPLLDLVYKDSYTDTNGKEIKFDKDTTFKEKYAASFDDSGGWKNVGIQAAIGTGMSSVGEFGNLRNILAPEGNKKVETEVDIKTNTKVDYKNIEEENNKITSLKERIEATRSNAHNNGRFSLFDTKFSNDILSKKLTYEKLTNFYNLIADWDKHCNLPYEVGISIDKLANDNTVMIHRTNLGLDKNTEGYTDNNTLYNIMTEGLKNYGHLNAVGGGAIQDSLPALTLTMTPLNGITGYINLIGSYKSNDVTIISAFPKDLVNEHGRIKGESNYYAVYDLSEETPKVKPEYMIGAILKKNNGLDEFYTRDEITKMYNNINNTIGSKTLATDATLLKTNELQKIINDSDAKTIDKIFKNVTDDQIEKLVMMTPDFYSSNIGKKLLLNESIANRLENIELTNELALSGSNTSNLLEQHVEKRQFFDSQKDYEYNNLNNHLTQQQIDKINEINQMIKQNGHCEITFNSTSELSSLMIDKIDDLSKVKINLLDGLGDSRGYLKEKYQGRQRYIDRVAYSGYEMKGIIEKIEYLQSKVDMNLPIVDRAKQIYEILATEIPPRRDYKEYQNGHQVVASLRGLTSYNSIGKEGLVCAGYSSVYKELCDRTGIKCDYVRGKATLDPLTGKFQGHAWNLVHTEEGLIPVDVTWKATNNGNGKWFGTSNEFVEHHIADIDEMNADYAETNMIPAVMFENSKVKLDKIVKILSQKYGSKDEAINVLERYINNQNPNIITRDRYARKLALSLEPQEIQQYIFETRNIQKINEVNNIIDMKSGQYGYGKRVLKEYLKTGNPDIITRTNGARNIITKMDINILRNYIKELGW